MKKNKEEALRYNEGKPQYSLINLKCLEPMARVLEFGAKKYSRGNWEKGMPTTKILDSILRHIAALQAGEEIDPESGLPHIGHIQCNALFLGNAKNEMDIIFNPTRSSGQVNLDFSFKYFIGDILGFKVHNLKKDHDLTGYKLVRTDTENFYSVMTGLYRYKTGPIAPPNPAIVKLYQDAGLYNSNMSGYITAFRDKPDLNCAFPSWKLSDVKLGIIKITFDRTVYTDASNKCWKGSLIASNGRILKMELIEDNF